MSVLGRPLTWRWVAALATVLVIAAGMLVAALTPSPREVVLVARGMAFYLDSDPVTPNPVIVVAPGEAVRVGVTQRRSRDAPRRGHRGTRGSDAVGCLEGFRRHDTGGPCGARRLRIRLPTSSEHDAGRSQGHRASHGATAVTRDSRT